MDYSHEPCTITLVKAQNMPDLIGFSKESININLSFDDLLAKYKTGFCGDGFFDILHIL